nr:MAG TPA: hypothetical protein [Caudoviricetes sp.]
MFVGGAFHPLWAEPKKGSHFWCGYLLTQCNACYLLSFNSASSRSTSAIAAAAAARLAANLSSAERRAAFCVSACSFAF